jgi:hypothetical protein
MPSICLPYGSGLPITRSSSVARRPGLRSLGQVLQAEEHALLVPPRM